MTNVPFAVGGLFAAAVTCAVLGGYVMFAMIGEVNRKLPEDQQISYLWGHYAKYQRILREYRRLYPKGRLGSAWMLLVALVFTLGIAAMVLAVYLSR